MIRETAPSTARREADALAAAALFRGLADSRRLMVLGKLHEMRSAGVHELADEVGMPVPAVGGMMAVMENERLVVSDGSAGTYRYRICDGRLGQLRSILSGVFAASPAMAMAAPGHPLPPRGVGMWL